MRAYSHLVSLAIVSLVLSQCSAQSVSDLKINSNIAGGPYEGIVDNLATFAKRDPNLFEVVTYGTSMGGKPLTMLKIANRNLVSASAAKRPMVMLTEAIHGNEFLDVAQSVIDDLANDAVKPGTPMNDFVARGGSLLFVPVVNPDGYEKNQESLRNPANNGGGPDSGNNWGRMNNSKQDLNRDFPIPSQDWTGNTQKETQAFTKMLAEQVAAGNQLEFSLDYHCCVGQGGLIQPIGYSNLSLPLDQQPRYAQFSNIYRAQLQGITVGNPAVVAEYQYGGGKEFHGMSMDSFFDIYKSVSFVYEGSIAGESSRSDAHYRAFSEALSKINGNYKVLAPGAGGGDIRLLLSEISGNQINLNKAATGTQIAEISVCEGTKIECRSATPKIIGKIPQSTSNATVRFFKGTAVVLKANTAYTLLAGTISQSFKLVPKAP